MRIYYNPRCSTCRKCLALLESKGVRPERVEYLVNPPSRSELAALVARVEGEYVRKKEPLYAELGLEGADLDTVLDALAAHPILLERPVVDRGDRALVARPPERALELL